MSILLVLMPCFLAAKPAQVIIIRHGEKPEVGNQLNQRGCERAYALPMFFLDNPIVMQYGSPVAIYAMQAANEDSSIRPIQTIAPTAAAFGLMIQNKYTKLQYKALAEEILNEPSYAGKTVICSWEHKVIPLMAQAFGLSLPKDMKKWPGAVFDQAWVLDFSSKKVTLQIVPEDLLPGDNPLGGKHWKEGSNDLNAEPERSPEIVSMCQNNDALNALVQMLVTQPLP